MRSARRVRCVSSRSEAFGRRSCDPDRDGVARCALVERAPTLARPGRLGRWSTEEHGVETSSTPTLTPRGHARSSASATVLPSGDVLVDGACRRDASRSGPAIARRWCCAAATECRWRAHAGWRGLAAGVIDVAVASRGAATMSSLPCSGRASMPSATSSATVNSRGGRRRRRRRRCRSPRSTSSGATRHSMFPRAVAAGTRTPRHRSRRRWGRARPCDERWFSHRPWRRRTSRAGRLERRSTPECARRRRTVNDDGRRSRRAGSAATRVGSDRRRRTCVRRTAVRDRRRHQGVRRVRRSSRRCAGGATSIGENYAQELAGKREVIERLRAAGALHRPAADEQGAPTRRASSTCGRASTERRSSTRSPSGRRARAVLIQVEPPAKPAKSGCAPGDVAGLVERAAGCRPGRGAG